MSYIFQTVVVIVVIKILKNVGEEVQLGNNNNNLF